MASTFTKVNTKLGPDDGQGTPIAVTTVGDKWSFTPARPVNIKRWGMIFTTALSPGAGAQFALDFRPVVDSDSGRINGATSAAGVDTAGGTLTTGTATVAVGKGLYKDVNPKLEVDPGEEVVFEVVDAADTTGIGFFFVEYEEEAFSGGSPATALSFANRISNLTKKLS